MPTSKARGERGRGREKERGREGGRWRGGKWRGGKDKKEEERRGEERGKGCLLLNGGRVTPLITGRIETGVDAAAAEALKEWDRKRAPRGKGKERCLPLSSYGGPGGVIR